MRRAALVAVEHVRGTIRRLAGDREANPGLPTNCLVRVVPTRCWRHLLVGGRGAMSCG